MARSMKQQDVIEQVAADLLNGKMKHEVLLKLREGMYEGQTMKYTNDRTANNILLKALEHFKFELQQTKDEMRVLAYNRMLAVYEDAVSVGDRTNALKALDMMNKLYGVEEPQKVDINADVNIRKINIRFGAALNDIKDLDELEDLQDEEQG